MYFQNLRCGPDEKEKQQILQSHKDGYKEPSSKKLEVNALKQRMKYQLAPWNTVESATVKKNGTCIPQKCLNSLKNHVPGEKKKKSPLNNEAHNQ